MKTGTEIAFESVFAIIAIAAMIFDFYSVLGLMAMMYLGAKLDYIGRVK